MLCGALAAVPWWWVVCCFWVDAGCVQTVTWGWFQMPQPATHNITIYQGDTFTLPLHFKDDAGNSINLTGWQWKAEVRPTYNGVLTQSMTIEETDIANGRVTLKISAANTANIVAGDYVWDVQAEHTDSTIRTYLAGKATVKAQVTE